VQVLLLLLLLLLVLCGPLLLWLHVRHACVVVVLLACTGWQRRGMSLQRQSSTAATPCQKP
jgi:hypothetical protein